MDRRPAVTERWGSSTSDQSVFLPKAQVESFVRDLLHSSEFLMQATSWEDGKQFFAEFMLDGRSDPDNPVRRVIEACEQQLPVIDRNNPWIYSERSEDSHTFFSAGIYDADGGSDSGKSLSIWCTYFTRGTSFLSVSLGFEESADFSSSKDGEVNVAWRIDDEPIVRDYWKVSLLSARTLFLSNGKVVELAENLIAKSELWIEATASGVGRTFSAAFRLGGRADPDHPVRQVLRGCRAIP